MLGLREVGAEALWLRLERLLEDFPSGAVVFDADGTLWSHDVGCMVFEAAYERAALKPEARDSLAREARENGVVVSSGDDANAIARLLEQALLTGRYDLRRAAEMQVWAYAGFSEVELRELCRLALSSPSHRAGLHHEVLELAAEARQRGAQVCIVSASPRIVVEEATRELGFPAECVAAGDPLWDGGKIAPAMGHPLPYGPTKATAGKQLLGDTPWVATFGDSGFDLDMMAEAKLAVGLGDKPDLLAGLSRHSHAYRLRLSR